jgi:hypothetical protein
MSLLSASDPSPVDDAITPAKFPEGVWRCPLELVLAAPSGSAMPRLVRQRMDRQDWPYPTVTVFVQGKRFFANVGFHGGTRPSLLYPLDIWAAENGQL